MESIEEQTANIEIERLLHQIVKKRVASSRWNIYTALMFYALLIAIVLLQFRGANIILVMGIATMGLLTLSIVTYVRGKRLEKRFFHEELENYQKLAVAGQNEVLQSYKVVLRNQFDTFQKELEHKLSSLQKMTKPS